MGRHPLSEISADINGADTMDMMYALWCGLEQIRFEPEVWHEQNIERLTGISADCKDLLTQLLSPQETRISWPELSKHNWIVSRRTQKRSRAGGKDANSMFGYDCFLKHRKTASSTVIDDKGHPIAWYGSPFKSKCFTDEKDAVWAIRTVWSKFPEDIYTEKLEVMTLEYPDLKRKIQKSEFSTALKSISKCK